MSMPYEDAKPPAETLALRCFAYDFGLTLRLFLPLPEERRLLGEPKSLALALLAVVAATFLTHYAIETSHQHPALVFSPWGAYASVTGLTATVAVVFLIALTNDAMSRLVAMLTGVAIVQTLAVTFGAVFAELNDVAEEVWTYFCLGIVVRLVVREIDDDVPRRLAVAVATAALLWAIDEVLPETRLFRGVPPPRPPPLNVEHIYLDQPRLVEEALATVLESEPGVAETYFVGFAPYSAQNVFLNEVRHAQALFQDKLDASRRTLLLANSRTTVDELPLANGHNLGLVLQGIAAKMDAEDLLFLHLTSHGSDDHYLSVQFENLGLNDLSAQEVGEIVNAADLPWRVIVVAACFSGGFVEPLQTPRTLVMTASSADAVSFGCEHGREYTYFGEALYKDNLVDGDYAGAFQRALKIVEEREVQEELTASEPQIWIGEEMAAKLPGLPESSAGGVEEMERQGEIGLGEIEQDGIRQKGQAPDDGSST